MKQYNLQLSMIEYSVLYGVLKKDYDFLSHVPLDEKDSDLKSYLKSIIDKLNALR